MAHRGDRDDRHDYVAPRVYPGRGVAWPWYDPWYGPFYGPAPYDPYWLYGYGTGDFEGYGQYLDQVAKQDALRARTGSIRFQVTPAAANVYIDGALVGPADRFDGVVDHLDLEAGAHQLELRADGYRTYRADILVTAGKTMTERVKLKKQ